MKLNFYTGSYMETYGKFIQSCLMSNFNEYVIRTCSILTRVKLVYMAYFMIQLSSTHVKSFFTLVHLKKKIKF